MVASGGQRNAACRVLQLAYDVMELIDHMSQEETVVLKVEMRHD